MAVPAHMPNPASVMPQLCPMAGKIKTASTLKRKIVAIEITTSLSFAPMTGATAAIAEPPQMAVPAPTSDVISRSSPSAFPMRNAAPNAAISVNIMT